MPALLPPPIPLFSCSITRTSGKRSRTKSTVPSVEPWSTTSTSTSTISEERTDARHCSSHGSAFHVTTTTETSGTGHCRAPVEHLLPQDHGDPWQREHDRHQEEQEAAREGGIGVDAQVAEEADEERLAHAEPVDRERHEHDEKQQRSEDDVGKQREMNPDRATGAVDGDDACHLHQHREGRDGEQRLR